MASSITIKPSVAIVTGAGGKGLAIARHISPGRLLLLADYSTSALEKARSQLGNEGYNVRTYAVDIASASAVADLASAAEEAGSVDVVVHTASVSPATAPCRKIFEDDLLGIALVVEAFREVLAPRGCIVCIASMAGHMLPTSLPVETERHIATAATSTLLEHARVQEMIKEDKHPGYAYCIAKRANHLRVQAAAPAFGKRGCRINSISPGVIHIAMGQQELHSEAGAIIKHLAETSALGRYGTAADIVNMVGFLVGPESSFLTCANFLVDSGSVAAQRWGGDASSYDPGGYDEERDSTIAGLFALPSLSLPCHRNGLNQDPLHRLFGVDVVQHDDLSSANFDKDDNLQVISLGLSRTGTTSLHAALTKLGFGPCRQGVDLFRSMPRNEAFIDLYSNVFDGTWKAGDEKLNTKLRSLISGYKSVTDMPIFPLLEEVYAAYPGAKYILTTRPGGAAAWWKSMQVLTWHLRRDWWRTLFRTCILPVYFIRRSDDTVQYIREVWMRRYGGVGPQIYDGHNEDVKKLVPKDKLLVYDVREGWEPLCKFLEVDVPAEPYPNLNDAESMAAIYTGMMTFGLFMWAAYIAGAGGLAYVAFKPVVARGLLERLLGLLAIWRQK